MKKQDALRVLPFGTICKRIVDIDGKGIYKVITESGEILAEHLHSNEIWGIAVENYQSKVVKEGATFTVEAPMVDCQAPIIGFGTFELSVPENRVEENTDTKTIPKSRHWRDLPVLGNNYYVKPRFSGHFSNLEYFKKFPSNSVFIAHKIVDDVIYTFTNGFKEGTPICHLDDFHMLEVSL